MRHCSFWFVNRHLDLWLAVTTIVLYADETGVVIFLKPACTILEHIEITIRAKRHIHGITELVAGHERLHFHEVAFLVHGHSHDPSPHPFINEQLTIVIIGESTGRTLEVFRIEYRTGHRSSSTRTYKGKLPRAIIRIPDECGLGGW